MATLEPVWENALLLIDLSSGDSECMCLRSQRILPGRAYIHPHCVMVYTHIALSILHPSLVLADQQTAQQWLEDFISPTTVQFD